MMSLTDRPRRRHVSFRPLRLTALPAERGAGE